MAGAVNSSMDNYISQNTGVVITYAWPGDLLQSTGLVQENEFQTNIAKWPPFCLCFNVLM